MPVAARMQGLYHGGVMDEAPRERKIKTIATNRLARHRYEIFETFEAGIELVGTEVKSLRQGKVNLKEGYGRVIDSEVFLVGVNISVYEQGNRFNHDPTRKRRLLLSRREIRKLFARVEQQGLTIVPLRLYFKGPYAKVEIGVARGKKLHDKRDSIAKRESDRDIERGMSRRR